MQQKRINNKIIIICYGYEGAESRNANAICLNNLLAKADVEQSFLIVTAGTATKPLNIYKNVELVDLTPQNSINNHKDVKKELAIFKTEAIKFLNSLLNLYENVNIVCISFPFVNLEIGNEIKKIHKNVSLVLYELDPYTYNSLLRFQKFLFFYRLYKEFIVFKRANKIFLTRELFDFYRENRFFKVFKEKYIELGIPMLNIQKDNFTKVTNEGCRIVYAGSLSKKNRDPSFMLKLFCKIKDKSDWTLHIYGADESAIDRAFLEELQHRIYVYKKVPRSDMPNIMRQATFLLNISNKNTLQLPSKILDYIGFRKPIINFYTQSDDLCKKYLVAYPNSLSIKENDAKVDVLATQLSDFIERNKGLNYSEESILAEYSEITTDSIAKKFKYHLKN